MAKMPRGNGCWNGVAGAKSNISASKKAGMRALATRRRPGRAASSIGGNSTQATLIGQCRACITSSMRSRGARSMAHFAGVKRRMEQYGIADGVTVYDDFAHHPSAILATIVALRARV